jgi:hypothetical protein
MAAITVMMIILSMTRMVGISSAATTAWVTTAPRPCPRRSRGSQACRPCTSGADREGQRERERERERQRETERERQSFEALPDTNYKYNIIVGVICVVVIFLFTHVC